MDYVLLVTTCILAAFRTITTKSVSAKKSFENATMINAFAFLIAFVVVILTGILSLGNMFNVPFWLCAAYAVCMVLAQIFLMKAVSIGPVSLSAFIYHCAFITATIFCSIYYKERIRALQIIGILIIILCFVLSVEKDDKKASLRWFFTILSGSIIGGLTGIWQKVLKNEYPTVELDNFMQTTFLFMVVFSFAVAFLLKGIAYAKQSNAPPIDNTTDSGSESKKKTICLIIILGVLLSFINKINTYLGGALPSVIVFPSLNGGGIVATTILSMIIFKERPRKKQVLALVLGVVGILTVAFGNII